MGLFDRKRKQHAERVTLEQKVQSESNKEEAVEKNEKRYSVEEFKGSNKKYNEI